MGLGDTLSEWWNTATEFLGEQASNAGSTIKDTALGTLGDAKDMLVDSLGSDFMKKFGWAGAMTFIAMTIFRPSWGMAGAGIAATIVGGLFSSFVAPHLSGVFNKAGGLLAREDDVKRNPEVVGGSTAEEIKKPVIFTGMQSPIPTTP